MIILAPRSSEHRIVAGSGRDKDEALAVELVLGLGLTVKRAFGELTVLVAPERLGDVLDALAAVHGFEQVMNFGFEDRRADGGIDLVIHLLSISRGRRLRVKTRGVNPFLASGFMGRGVTDLEDAPWPGR